MRRSALAVLAITALCGGTAVRAGDRLAGTGGVTQLEGSAGTGIVPWALIAGNGTREGNAGTIAYTRVDTGDFDLDVLGAAVGFRDRFEVSAARQELGLGTTVPGEKLRLDTFGAKVRLFGDAVYDQDRWWPQVAAGVQYKKHRDFDLVPGPIGALDDSSIDVYLAASKLWLAGLAGRNVLANLTLRSTEANQAGLLGFGGDLDDGRSLQVEVSAGIFLNDRVAVGFDFRQKPGNLSVFEENDWSDLWFAWFPSKSFSLTAALARLGTIADKGGQQGLYVSLQASF